MGGVSCHRAARTTVGPWQVQRALLPGQGGARCVAGGQMKKRVPQGLTVEVRVHADHSALQFQGWLRRSSNLREQASCKEERRQPGDGEGRAHPEDPSPRPAAALLMETREVQPPGTSQQEPGHMGDAKKSYCKISFFFLFEKTNY